MPLLFLFFKKMKNILLSFRWIVAPSLFLVLTSCKGGDSPTSLDSELALEGKSEAEVNLIRRGKVAFAINCTACHNSNPRENGAVGPAVVGSSLELLTARVLEGKFPEGYKPKVAPGAGTIQMPPMPQLKNELPALHAYLNALK